MFFFNFSLLFSHGDENQRYRYKKKRINITEMCFVGQNSIFFSQFLFFEIVFFFNFYLVSNFYLFVIISDNFFTYIWRMSITDIQFYNFYVHHRSIFNEWYRMHVQKLWCYLLSYSLKHTDHLNNQVQPLPFEAILYLDADGVISFSCRAFTKLEKRVIW